MKASDASTNRSSPSTGALNPLSRWAGLAGLAVLVLGRLFPLSPVLQSLIWPCPLKAASGVPCATCGSTRVAVLLAHGHFVDAISLAPLPAFGLLSALLLGAAAALGRFLGRRPDRLVLWILTSWRGRILACLVLLALYAITLWRFSRVGGP